MGPSVTGWEEGARLQGFDPTCNYSTVRNDSTFRSGGIGAGWNPFIRNISVVGNDVEFNLNSASNPFEGYASSQSMQGTFTIADNNVLEALFPTSPLVLRGSWTAEKQ